MGQEGRKKINEKIRRYTPVKRNGKPEILSARKRIFLDFRNETLLTRVYQKEINGSSIIRNQDFMCFENLLMCLTYWRLKGESLAGKNQYYSIELHM